MRGISHIAAIAAAGLASVGHSAVFTGVSSLRSAATGAAPVGEVLVLTGPSDTGFGSWFGNSTLNQSGIYAFASQGSELTSTSISAVGQTFAASSGTSRRVGANSTIDFIFTLDEAAVVTVFAEAGGSSGSSTTMRVYFGTETEAVINTTSPFGSFTDINLAAGTYILSAEIQTIIDGTVGSANGFYNLSVSVPGPGGIALLGLAGIVGVGRRRAR